MSAYEMRICDWSSDVCSSDLKDGSASVLSRPAVPDKLCRGRTFLRWSESAAPSGHCRTKNEPQRHAMNKQWAQYWIGLFADGTDELMTLYAPEFQFEDVNFDLRINKIGRAHV